MSIASLKGRSAAEVVAQLSARPEAEQKRALQAMLGVDAATASVARDAISRLGLEHHRDLMELATGPRLHARSPEAPAGAPRVNAGRGALAVRASQSTEAAPSLTAPQLEALSRLGVPRADYGRFLAGGLVLFHLPTQTGDDTEGFVRRSEGGHLTAGVVSVHAVGEGLRALTGFRTRAVELAKAFGHKEVEVMGAAIINVRLAAVLARQGFEPSTHEIPEAYGGGVIDVLAKRIEVPA